MPVDSGDEVPHFVEWLGSLALHRPALQDSGEAGGAKGNTPGRLPSWVLEKRQPYSFWNLMLR